MASQWFVNQRRCFDWDIRHRILERNLSARTDFSQGRVLARMMTAHRLFGAMGGAPGADPIPHEIHGGAGPVAGAQGDGAVRQCGPVKSFELPRGAASSGRCAKGRADVESHHPRELIGRFIFRRACAGLKRSRRPAPWL